MCLYFAKQSCIRVIFKSFTPTGCRFRSETADPFSQSRAVLSPEQSLTPSATGGGGAVNTNLSFVSKLPPASLPTGIAYSNI